MVSGRYNELVHGGYFMVYKPTNITGGPHPVWLCLFPDKSNHVFFTFDCAMTTTSTNFMAISRCLADRAMVLQPDGK